MDKTDACDVRYFMSEDITEALKEARFIAVEAIFELDPFDREAQKDFEDALENL